MAEPTTPPSHASVSDYLAAERTFLAWIRTGLALMGFGFVVARFGLFLHEMASLRTEVPPHRGSVSVWIGTVLVLLGVAVTSYAAAHHWRAIERLERGESLPRTLGATMRMRSSSDRYRKSKDAMLAATLSGVMPVS